MQWQSLSRHSKHRRLNRSKPVGNHLPPLGVLKFPLRSRRRHRHSTQMTTARKILRGLSSILAVSPREFYAFREEETSSSSSVSATAATSRDVDSESDEESATLRDKLKKYRKKVRALRNQNDLLLYEVENL